MTITVSMLPAKLQYVYDYIHNKQTKNASEISYDQFKKLLSSLELLPSNGMIENHANTESELLQHIFSTFQEASKLINYFVMIIILTSHCRIDQQTQS